MKICLTSAAAVQADLRRHAREPRPPLDAGALQRLSTGLKRSWNNRDAFPPRLLLVCSRSHLPIECDSVSAICGKFTSACRDSAVPRPLRARRQAFGLTLHRRRSSAREILLPQLFPNPRPTAPGCSASRYDRQAWRSVATILRSRSLSSSSLRWRSRPMRRPRWPMRCPRLFRYPGARARSWSRPTITSGSSRATRSRQALADWREQRAT